MLRRLVEISGRPLSFTLLDISLYPGRWRTLLREVEKANRDGLRIRGQVAARPVQPIAGPAHAVVAALPAFAFSDAIPTFASRRRE